jgi:hypothetical protein
MKWLRCLFVFSVSAGLVSSLTGCGNSNLQNFITQIQTKTYSQNENQWVQLDATLNTGGFRLASIQLPVVDPNNPDISYGQLGIVSTQCGVGCYGGILSLSVNVTHATKLPGQSPRLPNGTPLPIGGVGLDQIIVLPVAQTGAKVYLAFASGIATLGAAIPFAAMDPAGKYVPGANLFIPAQIGPVSFTAGLFVGAEPLTTGIGVFVDLGQVIIPPKASFAQMDMNSSDNLKSILGIEPSSFQNQLVLKSVKPSRSKQKDFYRIFSELNDKGLTLDLK